MGSERVRFIHHEFLWIGFGSVSLRNRDVTSNSCGQYIYKYINGVYYIYNIIYICIFNSICIYVYLIVYI